jgi:hypothetical protein
MTYWLNYGQAGEHIETKNFQPFETLEAAQAAVPADVHSAFILVADERPIPAASVNFNAIRWIYYSGQWKAVDWPIERWRDLWR